MKLDVQSIEGPEEYYSARHAANWMEYWPDNRKSRVIGLIADAGVGGADRVLEFGCGVGVFTHALKSAMPSLEVHGCDISRTGIAKSRERAPLVHFHLLTDAGAEPPLSTFDFIYTHHVLEHVADLGAALEQIAGLLKPGGKVLHILPCANPGSLQHRIALLVRGGVSRVPETRFCIDDSSHVRRPTSSELEAAFARCGLVLRQARFAGQFWGSLEYLSKESHHTLMRWLNPTCAVSLWASLKLLAWLLFLVPLFWLRNMPPYILNTFRHRRSRSKQALVYGLLPLALLLWPVSICLDKLLNTARDWEWRHRSTQPNGAEMYLLFERPT
jgi:SAM-dependent methyltransferase